MAHMYPENGPVKDTASGAERHIYDVLRRGLSDDYRVFHGVTWQEKEQNGAIRSGEVDFLIVHPSYGLLLLEVKGGGIDYDGVDQLWWSRDRNGEFHEIKDPFKQVSVSAQTLKRFLKNTPLTQPHCGNCWIGYGVWFPDITWVRGTAALPHVQDDLVLDASDMLQPEAGLLRLYQFHEQTIGQQRHHSLNDEALAALDSVLAPTIHITSRLADRIIGEERRISELTDEQFQQLERMRRYHRLAIQGAAGTGKTVLAIEKARRLAAQGLTILIVCVNPRLAGRIKNVFQQESTDIREHVQVYCLDELCQKLAADAGIPHLLSSRTDQKLLDQVFIRSLKELKAKGKKDIQFDAILVDEGQDIERPIWGHLNALLRNKTDGIFYVFYDPAQRDIPHDWVPPTNVARKDLPLTMNCRNTQTIFQLIKQFYRGLDELECGGPEGRPVWFRDPAQCLWEPGPDEDREILTLRDVLDELIDEQGIQPEDLLIISCRPQQSSKTRQGSRWYKQDTVGAHKLTWKSEDLKTGKVAISTIRAAKGLERKVVILAELDGVASEPKRDALLYIALSRAMYHLVVLGAEEQLAPHQPALWTVP